MSDIKISIVMAVYNRAKVVEQAISSVVNQTYKNIEFIIIDGGSTDGTVDIIKKYEDKIAYWLSEPDTGIYNALNKGIKHASGDYIQILGSDDCLHDKHTIEDVVKELNDLPGMLCCDVVYIKPEHNVEWVRGTNANFLIQTPNHQGIFVQRSLLLRYPFDEKYRIAADYNFMLTCYTDENVNIKRSSLKVVYYELGGLSGVREEDFRKELDLIYLKFSNGTDLRDIYKPSVLKKGIKKVLIKLGLFDAVQVFINVQIKKKWRKHYCNNKICRWCGRKF